jgi:hypothetical protein
MAKRKNEKLITKNLNTTAALIADLKAKTNNQGFIVLEMNRNEKVVHYICITADGKVIGPRAKKGSVRIIINGIRPYIELVKEQIEKRLLRPKSKRVPVLYRKGTLLISKWDKKNDGETDIAQVTFCMRDHFNTNKMIRINSRGTNAWPVEIDEGGIEYKDPRKEFNWRRLTPEERTKYGKFIDSNF